MSHAARSSWMVALMTIVLLAVSMASADAAPSPRAVVEMDGMSVVLVAADRTIHAYVDRIADNAPVDDATLVLELRDSGVRLDLRQVSPGLFVAPFQPSGRDRFLVTLTRAGNPSSESVAELVRDSEAAAVPAEPVAASQFGKLAWLLVGLLALLALGILLGGRYVPAMRGWRPVGPNAG